MSENLLYWSINWAFLQSFCSFFWLSLPKVLCGFLSPYLLFVAQYDMTSLLHHLKDHDPAQLPPDRHGHVGERRQLVHELQQLLCME